MVKARHWNEGGWQTGSKFMEGKSKFMEGKIMFFSPHVILNLEPSGTSYLLLSKLRVLKGTGRQLQNCLFYSTDRT